MELFQPDSSAIHGIAYDPSGEATRVYIAYKSSPNQTYRCDCWSREIAAGLIVASSVGQAVSTTIRETGATLTRIDAAIEELVGHKTAPSARASVAVAPSRSALCF